MDLHLFQHEGVLFSRMFGFRHLNCQESMCYFEVDSILKFNCCRLLFCLQLNSLFLFFGFQNVQKSFYSNSSWQFECTRGSCINKVVPERNQEKNTDKKSNKNAYDPNNFQGWVVTPVNLRNIWIKQDLLIPSKTMVKTMKTYILKMKRKNQQ